MQVPEPGYVGQEFGAGPEPFVPADDTQRGELLVPLVFHLRRWWVAHGLAHL